MMFDYTEKTNLVFNFLRCSAGRVGSQGADDGGGAAWAGVGGNHLPEGHPEDTSVDVKYR